MAGTDFSIPGKVFVLGEYAVLAGQPGVIAAVSPRFVGRVLEVGAEGEGRGEQKGPVARLRQWLEREGVSDFEVEFRDPYQGAGGFGASTAEFALAYRSSLEVLGAQEKGDDKVSWKEVWKLYRRLMNQEPLVPSGADLVGQWEGGISFFDPRAEEVYDLWSVFDWSRLLVFSATQQKGRKVATHSHLDSLAGTKATESRLKEFEALGSLVRKGTDSILKGDVRQLGKSMDEYAETLHSMGLECAQAFEDRKFLRSLPGVLGVKGAGALLADVVLVLMDCLEESETLWQRPRGRQRQKVIEAAEARGLCLVSNGIDFQKGITCHRFE